ncbi:MAG: hypothetical protein ACYC4L_04445 [Chloroflexota bacterium]
MSDEIAEALAAALERVRQGSSLEEALACCRPEHRADLAPLLRLAAAITPPADSSPSPAFRRQLRAQLRRERRAEPEREPARPLAALWGLFSQRRTSMPAFLAMLLLVMGLVGGGGAYAAQAGGPEEALYSLRLGLGEAALLMPMDDTARAARHLDLAEQMLDHMEAQAGGAHQVTMLSDLDRASQRLASSQMAMERALAGGQDVTAVGERMQHDSSRLAAMSPMQSGQPTQMPAVMPTHTPMASSTPMAGSGPMMPGQVDQPMSGPMATMTPAAGQGMVSTAVPMPTMQASATPMMPQGGMNQGAMGPVPTQQMVGTPMSSGGQMPMATMTATPMAGTPNTGMGEPMQPTMATQPMPVTTPMPAATPMAPMPSSTAGPMSGGQPMGPMPTQSTGSAPAPASGTMMRR